MRAVEEYNHRFHRNDEDKMLLAYFINNCDAINES